uniref:Uncharacterized protein n=1 Tax=Anguilla anguilla TaxID=7936 RepID=A0A0E9QHI6_ANGAN
MAHGPKESFSENVTSLSALNCCSRTDLEITRSTTASSRK